MKIQSFRIRNFKSIEDLEIVLDENLNVLTGVNNCGKTTILEAIALWVECFDKLIHLAKRAVKGRYTQGDYVFGPSTNKYFGGNDIVSVRSPNFEDIFRDRNLKNKIILTAVLVSSKASETIEIPFSITNSTSSRYIIQLENEKTFDYSRFNQLFRHLPNAVESYFASPVANVEQVEYFTTTPNIQEKIRQRKSYAVIRNRLYKLYHTTAFSQFQQDLSYILFGKTAASTITFSSPSDMNKDQRVVINYQIGKDVVEKDLALLGSGTLQTIEILLNLYHIVDEKKDLNLILLDEPDSHIHRDIQNRLLEILKRTTENNQIILTSHNESLIKSTALSNLFHIDGSGKGRCRCLYKGELPKLNVAHFCGIYPTSVSPIIKSLGNDCLGLDFVSAIEADQIVFVEGDDDARLLYKLFNTNPANMNKKMMFWVLGGVSKMLDKVESYKIFFGEIKNRKSLWDKSILFFDRDRMTDEHAKMLMEKLYGKMSIASFSANLYTQESVLLSDFIITATLLCKRYRLESTVEKVASDLQIESEKCCSAIKMELSNLENNFIQQYKGQYLEKMENRLQIKIKINDIDLARQLQDFYKTQFIARIAQKQNVSDIINAVLQKNGCLPIFDVETSFYELVQYADTSTLYEEWKRMISFFSNPVVVE